MKIIRRKTMNELVEKLDDVLIQNVELNKKIEDLNYQVSVIANQSDETKKNVEILGNQLVGVDSKDENKQDIIKSNFDSLNDRLNKDFNDVFYILNEFREDEIINFRYSNFEINNLALKNDGLKILLCGFFGAFNVGDELMLQVVTNELRKMGHNNLTLMLADNEHLDYTKYNYTNYIHYPTKINDYDRLAKIYDVVIFCGGALLDDYDYGIDKRKISLGTSLLYLSSAFIVNNKKTILYGLSTNKVLSDNDYINKLIFVINNSDYFSLRDTNSVKTLKKSGVEISKIKIVNDTCLSENKLLKCVPNIKDDQTLTIGIIYILNEETIVQMTNFTRKLLDYLKSLNKKYELGLIPFYSYRDNDNNYYQKIIDSFPNEKITLLNFTKEYPEIIENLCSYNYIISMRYHSTLISNVLSKNILCINFDVHRHYYNKITYIYEKYKPYKNIINYSDCNSKQIIKNFDRLFNSENTVDIRGIVADSKKDLEEALNNIE